MNDTVNSNLYVDNPAGTDPYNTEMDGFTITMTMTAPVNSGVNNTIKIGLADGGDDIYDTNVMIAGDSVQTVALAMQDDVTLSTNSSKVVDLLLNDIDQSGGGLTVTEINGQAISIGQTITLNTGEQITLNADGTITVTSDGDVGTNALTYSVVDSNGVTDVGYVTIQTIAAPTADGTVQGTAGNDTIDGSYLGDPDGDLVDANDAILPGMSGDDDLIEGFNGDDTIYGGAGDDTVYGGADNDSIGDWATEAGNDTFYGDAGDDFLNGGADDDELYGGTGNDTLTGGVGNDTLDGGTGSDQFWITDDHESDTIVGGEDVGDGDTDTVDFSNYTSTQGVTITGTGDEAGTYAYNGTAGSGSFSQIEEVIGTDYDDNIDMSADSSGMEIDGEAGADTFTGGSGDDTISLGNDSPGVTDGDADVVVLTDGFGNDTITNIDAPTPNGDGTFTGIDTFDVTGLTDGTDPVHTNDVTVTNDGSGNAVLTFPNGESVTLIGISPVDADDPFYLNALGIPLPDGTVEGTAGNDTIDGSYTGDPDGDMVDAGDAILAGDTGDDDLIYGYGGNDSITAGAGDDEIHGGADDDTINAGAGDDTVYAGTGDDAITIGAGSGSDTVAGGEDIGDGDTDTLTFTDGSGPDGVNVTMTGDEAGNYGFPTDGGSGTFSEIEQIVLTDQDDTFNGTAATGGNTVDGGAGDDTLIGSDGSDSFTGGAGNDTLNANQGDDTLDAGAGNDTVFGDEGADSILGGDGNDDLYGGGDNDTIDAGADDDTIEGGAGDDTLTGGAGADTITGGADQDVIYGGAGDVIDGSETGTDNDTLIVSGVDYIDYDDLNPENGIVYFEGGGSLTFTNIENVVVSDRDGTVSGTAGNDTIDASYTGDPDGDQVDDTDAILVGDEPNDDLIEAGAGDDDIYAGLGDDEIYAGADNDTVAAGLGDDTIFGEGGNDLLFGQGGADTVYGGTGDDIINGGAQADTLFGGDDQDRFILEAGFGSDVIEGGEGGSDSDEIWSTQGVDVTVTATGDEAGTISDGTSTATFSEIEAIETAGGDDTIDLSGDSAGMTVESGAGADTITGGSGDDSVSAGDGHDVIAGGDGADTMTGGSGNDDFIIEDGFGNDTIIGGETGEGGGDVLDGTALTENVTLTLTGDEVGTLENGTDTANFDEIETFLLGDGFDTAYGGVGDDYIDGGGGGDTLLGGAGDDTLKGDAGDDNMQGGTGADTLTGGTGDDAITFAEGDDAWGDDGNDLFVLEDLGELSNGTITVTGGNSAETLGGGDTLQLGSLADLSTLVQTSNGINASGNETYSGSVTLDDGTILNFSEIENIICFTPGTRIATPYGARPIETLKVGDMIVTRDHGLQPIRWIESRTVPAVDRFAPVRIRPGVVTGLEREIVVSPQHRMMFNGYRAELLFGESEVLVAATHLVDGVDVTQDAGGEVTYVHMMFDAHEVIYAEGAATESFHPGDMGMTAVSDEAREELFAIFPELRSNVNGYGPTARRCLKQHEAKLIRA